jgi:hypothetical protein
MSNKTAAEIDAATGEVSDYHPEVKSARYRAKLDTLADVKREMARLYRESRSGTLGIQDMTKYVWALKSISEVIDRADVEDKLNRLERELLQGGGNEQE